MTDLEKYQELFTFTAVEYTLLEDKPANLVFLQLEEKDSGLLDNVEKIITTTFEFREGKLVGYYLDVN